MSAARRAPSPSAPFTVPPAADLAGDPVAQAAWLEGLLTECFHMDVEDARMITGLVVEQFRGRDEVLDDELPTEIRSVFYTLETKRILTFRRIEYKGEEGETRRGFFWRFNVARNEVFAEIAESHLDEGDVYSSLPADCWSRRSTSA